MKINRYRLQKLISESIKKLIYEQEIEEEPGESLNVEEEHTFKISGVNSELTGFAFSQEKRERAAYYAIQEESLWNGRHDNDPECSDILRKYWRSFFGGGRTEFVNHLSNPEFLNDPHFCDEAGMRVPGHPWSAAFVRWCMQKAGYSEFNDISHIPFFMAAYRNRVDFIQNNESIGDGAYMLFFTDEIDESDIVKGDNGIFFRGAGAPKTEAAARTWFENNIDNDTHIDSHSDICVSPGVCIGGNVGSPGTVEERDIPGRWRAVVKYITGYEYAPELYASSTV